MSAKGRITSRLLIAKAILWFLLGVAATAGAARFIRGLGATTALSDKMPWGLWIGFDVLSGVALAAGGFVIAAVVYIAHMERYRPLARPAILTAFIGYAAVAVALAFDVGLPWNLWRPLFHQQRHSALFEVAMCVMLYLSVLALEFSPVVLERFTFKRPLAFMKPLILPLVVSGIILSTLHQSSLGTLFVIMPSRVHPLWYTPMLPILFLMSAVGLGLAMVTLESLVSSWLYDQEPDVGLLGGLARASSFVLASYALIRILDIAARGKLSYVGDWTWESCLFAFELLISTVIPALAFSFASVRKSHKGLLLVAGTIVVGFILNRMNFVWLATIRATGASYFPSWTELAVTLGIVSGAGLVFFFFVENFSVYEKAITASQAPSFGAGDAFTGLSLASVWGEGYRHYSLIFVLGAAFSFSLLPDGTVRGALAAKRPVRGPRRTLAVRRVGADGMILGWKLIDRDSTSDDSVEVLTIDGNRDKRFVLFNHDAHIKREGENESCDLCHHMNIPNDRETSCWECHRDMYLPTDMFDHDLHVREHNGNSGCAKCHKDLAVVKDRQTATVCEECHEDMRAAVSRVSAAQSPADRYIAASYIDAMHGLCIPCHQERHPDIAGIPAQPTLCGFCHNEDMADTTD